MSIIWTVLQGSGIKDSLTLIYGSATIKNLMNAHDYKKSLRALKMVFIFLLTSQLAAYIEENKNEESMLRHIIHEFEANFDIQDMRKEIRSNEILNKFQTWKSKKTIQNINFAYWNMILEQFLTPLFTHIISIRIGNFEAGLEAWQCFLKHYYAFNHCKYAKMGSNYLFEIQTCTPWLLSNLKHNVSATITGKPFTKLALDEAIECTINRESKSKSGISGKMDDDRLHSYYRSSSLGAKMLRTVEELLSIEENGSEMNIENTFSRIQRDISDLKIIINSIKINPFMINNNTSFMRLSTGIIVPDDVVKEILNAGALGAEQSLEFITKRLIEKSMKYDDKIVRNRIRTLSSWDDVPRLILKQTISEKEKRKIQLLFSNIALVRTHRLLDMDYIFRHEFFDRPVALTDDSGGLYRPQEKYSVSDYIEELFPSHVRHTSLPTVSSGHMIFEGSELLKNTIPSIATTYEEYGRELIQVIIDLFRTNDRIDIVFNCDKPFDFQTSTAPYPTAHAIKAVIQPNFKIIKKTKSWQEFILCNEVVVSTCLKQIWCGLYNMIPPDKQLIVSGPDENSIVITKSGHTNCNELQSNHFQSSTRLILNASMKFGRSYSVTVIKSTNVDILIICLSMYNTAEQTWLDMIPSSKNKDHIPQLFDVTSLHHDFFIRYMISNDILLTLHAISRTQFTSHVRGISKKTIFDKCLRTVENYENLTKFGSFPLPKEAFVEAEALLLACAKSCESSLDHARTKVATYYLKEDGRE
ncbi:unnamed protein product [Didymodactylos carnosus]|uniref:Uncharacterized protein n=3 Tax=Didymodactylos carnosus TaxID=1234261 RepID=A0A814PXI9_9BILA|nr:unnamed protein product [Didymodactylos carnosus]CAF3876162.1 unnamed protein product [Didymodactylos carnosus]